MSQGVAREGAGPPRTVCVAGMHRSGTSLATRMLHLLGVDLGDEALLMAAGPDNAAGYWENRLVREVDDLVLAELGGSWDQPPPLDPGWQHDPALAPLRAEAADVLDQAFGPAGDRPPCYGWKDPRLSLLLPFWETVVPIDLTVVVVRDPAQVADSLHVRNGLSAPHSAALWLQHLLAATAPGRPHLLITHEDLVGDLDRSLDRLAAALALPAPGPEVRARAREHLDPSLQHHTRRSAERGGAEHDDNPVVALAAAVWADGAPSPGVVEPMVAEALRRGWLRSPDDAFQLQHARARAVVGGGLQRVDPFQDQHVGSVDANGLVGHVVALVVVDRHGQDRLSGPGR